MAHHTPVWFITGTSSGFGHDMALAALNLGHKVIATARNVSRIQDLADAGAHVMAFDVTAPMSSMQEAASAVFKQHGRVDYLINTAGYVLFGAVEEISSSEVYDCFNTNVFGVMNTVQAFLPGLRSQDVGQEGVRATIATFGSLAAWNIGAGFSAYSMTKACAHVLADVLKDELSPFSIRATVVEPGYFRTNFLQPNAMIGSAKTMPAYRDEITPVSRNKQVLDSVNGKQLGDVKKGSQTVVDVLTGTGVAKGRQLPSRIVLGSDCVHDIKEKCTDVMATVDEWKDVACGTDHV